MCSVNLFLPKRAAEYVQAHKSQLKGAQMKIKWLKQQEKVCKHLELWACNF